MPRPCGAKAQLFEGHSHHSHHAPTPASPKKMFQRMARNLSREEDTDGARRSKSESWVPRECHKGLQHAPQAASHLAPKKHRPGSTTKRNRATFGEALVLSDLFFCQIHNWLQFVLSNDMWPRTMQRSAQARLSGPCKRCRTGVSRLQALAKGGRVRCAGRPPKPRLVLHGCRPWRTLYPKRFGLWRSSCDPADA